MGSFEPDALMQTISKKNIMQGINNLLKKVKAFQVQKYNNISI
jgi:hypothetical protein